MLGHSLRQHLDGKVPVRSLMSAVDEHRKACRSVYRTNRAIGLVLVLPSFTVPALRGYFDLLQVKSSWRVCKPRHRHASKARVNPPAALVSRHTLDAMRANLLLELGGADAGHNERRVSVLVSGYNLGRVVSKPTEIRVRQVANEVFGVISSLTGMNFNQPTSVLKDAPQKPAS